MFEDSVPSDSFGLVNNQASLNEILGILTNFGIVGKSQWFFCDVLAVSIEISANPWAIAKYHFVEHQTKTPYV